jgi:hypothetical protein
MNGPRLTIRSDNGRGRTYDGDTWHVVERETGVTVAGPGLTWTAAVEAVRQAAAGKERGE